MTGVSLPAHADRVVHAVRVPRHLAAALRIRPARSLAAQRVLALLGRGAEHQHAAAVIVHGSLHAQRVVLHDFAKYFSSLPKIFTLLSCLKCIHTSILQIFLW